MNERRTFAVRGMHCASCVARLEKALGAIPGVRDPVVNLALNEASFRASAGFDATRVAQVAGFELVP
ncbi:MAG: heavy-metal-associated domain-containing protein, partial [Planctomycetota bacterium]|nr:heavy-metal-associated domain-containing protein [Planctomycetota bacterium]